MKFEHLFTPIDIGPITLRNRIYVTPHATMFASDNRDNLPGERLASYCAERAKGGAALIEVSMAIPGGEAGSLLSPGPEAHFSHLASGYPGLLSGRWPIDGSNPRVVEGYSKLARRVHEEGGKCFIEVCSSGSNLGNVKGVSSFPAPSIINMSPLLPFTSREMSQEDIDSAVESYGVAAKYVRDGGLDGVDLHGTYGSLICEFLSGIMNRRKDGYGGSIENRTRFLVEIIKCVREYTNDEIAVGMRLLGDDGFKGGNTPEDAAEIARLVDGKLDWITADTGNSPQHEDWQSVPMYVQSGYNLRITSPIKAAVEKTKIGAVGRYVDPFFAEQLIANGEADIVAMTRALIADPELPNKAKEGRIDAIKPCIGSLQDCWGRMNKGLPMSCTVNPAVGREREWGIGSLKQAGVRKRVLVIGGGPAGLEAARICAERGHSVVLYERSKNLGGQVLLASKLPGRVDLRAIVTWQINEIKRLGVDIRLGLEVSQEPEIIQFVLDEEKPDAVVIATGSSAIRDGFQPYTFNGIEGWDQSNVCTETDILEQRVTVGENVLVADTLSFIEAPGIAELLAREGKRVEIITFHSCIGLELKMINHWEHLFPRLYSLNVKITPFTWIKRISGKTVETYNVFFEKDVKRIENIDNVVLITGKTQNDSLYNAFSGKMKEVYLVGDANIGGARIGNAIFDGESIGRMI